MIGRSRKQPEQSREIIIEAGEHILGSLVITGVDPELNFQALTPERCELGNFRRQEEAVTELLAAWIAQQNAPEGHS